MDVRSLISYSRCLAPKCLCLHSALGWSHTLYYTLLKGLSLSCFLLGLEQNAPRYFRCFLTFRT